MIQFDEQKSAELAEKYKALHDHLPALCATQTGTVLKGSSTQKTPEKSQRIAVLFSGGPASGGHNIIVGIHEVLGDRHTLLGVKAGPKGLLNGDLVEIMAEDVAHIRNTGGFDFLGSDRTKIKTEEQFESVREVVKTHQLDGVIVVGGDDSNTNAAFLADRLADLNCNFVFDRATSNVT
jgi:pyrophosphate--fructose-6-phosphate 1-phosphotransferase